jgi:hypothetical protein
VHLAWREEHAEDLAVDRATTRELGWQARVAAKAAELERPAWTAELGEPPTSVRGRRALRHATGLLSAYRERYQVTDPARALGAEPRGGDLEQRRAYHACQDAVERQEAKQRAEREQMERSPADQPAARPARADRARSVRDDERAGRGREAG